LYYGAFTPLWCREGERAGELARDLMELCREQGFALLLAGGMILHGGALAQRGQTEAGAAQVRQGLVDWQATGALSHRPYQLALLAEVLGQQGQVEQGLIALAEALALCSDTGERFWEAELLRLRGELLLSGAGGDPPVSEAEG